MPLPEYKVVINRCYGGFGISDACVERMAELGSVWATRNMNCEYYDYNELDRHDPILVQAVEELGDKANGDCAGLEIVKWQPVYEIHEYDGMESLRDEY